MTESRALGRKESRSEELNRARERDTDCPGSSVGSFDAGLLHKRVEFEGCMHLNVATLILILHFYSFNDLTSMS